MKKPVLLTIIDGLGYDKNENGNAWKLANTPMLDSLLAEYPNSTLKAAGDSVGLPEGQIGNSEVGHLNIGAGQIVYTGLSLIRKALDDKSFYKNEAFLKSAKHAQDNNGTVHVMGLMSPGGVHSLDIHIFEILKMLHETGVKDVTVHAFTDGRDVAPRSFKSTLEKLINTLNEYGYKLGSIAGRLYAMDRDAMFEKTEKAYETLKGNATNKFTDPIAYLESQYNDKDLNDEFIECAVSSEKDVNFLQDNDSVIFFNFRPDRARQLAHLIIGSSLYEAKPKNPVSNVQMTIMMPYEGIKADVAFDSMEVKTPIGTVLANAGKKQLRIAETQKYAHVTFFMDGGKDVQLEGADRILVDSAKIDNFADNPEMSAKGITEKLIPVLGNYDVVIMNYANPDMVGHTGDLQATIKAVETIDNEIAKLKDKADQLGGTMFITSDHGNAEIMADDKGNVVTKHTTSDVPLIVTDKEISLKDGSLVNVAPTILDYINVEKGKAMDHDSLLKK